MKLQDDHPLAGMLEGDQYIDIASAPLVTKEDTDSDAFETPI